MGPAFLGLYVLLNFLAILTTGLIVYWGSSFSGGFSLADRAGRFNWHPLLMSVGFLFLYGNGLLTFKTFENRNVSRQTIKIAHAALNFIGGIFAVLGLVVVFMYHIGPGLYNLYSLHSWVGLITVVLYEINYVLGLICFFIPQTPGWIRSLYKPYHIFVGQALIALIVISFISGLLEKAMFLNYKEKLKYTELPAQHVLINVLGLLIMAVGGLAAFLATQKGILKPKTQPTKRASVAPKRSEATESDPLLTSDYCTL